MVTSQLSQTKFSNSKTYRKQNSNGCNSEEKKKQHVREKCSATELRWRGLVYWGKVNEKSGEAKGEPLGTGAVEEERQRERDRDRKTGREAEREKVRDGKWARSTF